MAPRKIEDLLLAPLLSKEEVAILLGPYGFSDVIRADAILQVIADEPRERHLLASILGPLLDAISRSADPDQSLLYFQRYTESAFNKLTLFSYLQETPHAISLLAQVLGASPFMAQILQRDPYYLYWVSDPTVLRRCKTREEHLVELRQALRSFRSDSAKADYLRVFKRKELLRIGVRDLIREADVRETTADLSALAQALVEMSYSICRRKMVRLFGRPSGTRSCDFVVLGMGKLGGGELNFSSDIDLIYLYDGGRRRTIGIKGRSKTRILSESFYHRLAQELTSVLTLMTGEGTLFRVDLRLRPEGQMGHIADTLGRALRYYRRRGKNWERLALLKAWPVAGEVALGKRFLKAVESFVYPRRKVVNLIEDVLAVRQDIEKKMRARGEIDRNIKLGIGGIREIEFLVQSLQVRYGHRLSSLRDRSTLGAIEKLERQKFLSASMANRLTAAYLFLRDLEHKLQMVHEAQTHVLPQDPAELRRCAIRMGYRDNGEYHAEHLFLRDLDEHRRHVRALYNDLVHLCDAGADRPPRDDAPAIESPDRPNRWVKK